MNLVERLKKEEIAEGYLFAMVIKSTCNDGSFRNNSFRT